MTTTTPAAAPPILTFWVGGLPVSQGSKTPKPVYVGKPCKCCRQRRLARVNLTESDRLAPWRDEIATFAGLASSQLDLITGPVHISARFYLPRPKDHYGTGRNAGRLRPSAPPAEAHVKKPDADKLLRAVLDALTGVVFVDDSQVVSALPVKRYADPGEDTGVRVTVKVR